MCFFIWFVAFFPQFSDLGLFLAHALPFCDANLRQTELWRVVYTLKDTGYTVEASTNLVCAFSNLIQAAKLSLNQT